MQRDAGNPIGAARGGMPLALGIRGTAESPLPPIRTFSDCLRVLPDALHHLSSRNPSMRPSFVRATPPRVLRAAALLLAAGCSEGTSSTEPQPEPDAGISGITNANAVVCARNVAGTTWCSQADVTGAFRITRADGPATGTGLLPAAGVFDVFTVDCPGAAKPVDRGTPQRNGGSWLDVRCRPDGCMAPPSGLLAWYRFDEVTGDSAVDHANAAPPSRLTLYGAGHAPGKVLGGMLLDGAAGHAEGAGDKNLGTGDFSIALWMRASPDAWSFSSILDKRDAAPIRGYHLALSGGELLLQMADAGEYAGWYNYHSGIFGVTDGGWHFVVVTVERASTTGIKWYVDGHPAGAIADPTGRRGSLSSSAPLRVGRHSHYEGVYFGGGIDELQLFNRVLPPAEVTALHNRHLCR